MNNLIYIGNFYRLLRNTFGDTVQKEFIIKNLPFIIYDYDEMKRKCSDVCTKLNYEYVDEFAYTSFVNKWRDILRIYNQLYFDIDDTLQ